MRQLPILAALLAAGAFSATGAQAELVMTAPPELVAGSASTLLLRSASTGDLDPTTGPTATVDGTDIRIVLNDECPEIWCDVVEFLLFRVDLPPLQEGDYQVTVYSGDGSATPVPGAGFTLAVGPEAAPSQAMPSEGFWMPVDRPGTGLHLQHRGDTLAVSLFDQVDGEPAWRIDAAPLRGDSAIVLLRDFAGGSCFGCDPYAAPAMGGTGGLGMRLHFDSARTAIAELADGTVLPLVNLAFGASYVAADLGTDATYGPLALPDLAGRWAIHGPVFAEDIVPLGPAQPVQGGAFLFDASNGELRVECVPASDDRGAGCFLSDTRPSPPLLRMAFAPLGDVTESRVVFGPSQADGEPVVAVRVPPPGMQDDAGPLPADGFWTIPGRSGTGVHFQQRGELLAASLFDFAQGAARWRLGVAPLGHEGTDVALHAHSGGSCFACAPHVRPTADAEPPVATIVFDSARRATVDLGGDTVIPLVNLAFGTDYIDVQLPGGGDGMFGPLYLPDLSGTWAFDLPGDAPGSRIAVLEAEYVAPGSPPSGVDGPVFTRFAGEFLDGERVELGCRPGNEIAPAGCELRIGDFQIGTPPPNWYPFARLGDIEQDRVRFVGGAGTDPANPAVFYAVRIPAVE